MRILFINNYYSPCSAGWGYRQLCEEVVDGLAAKGHDVAVLTSTRCDGSEIDRSYAVHRLLTIDPDWDSGKSASWQFFVGRRKREKEAVAYLMRLVKEFQPQVIFVWHAIGLPRVLLRTAEQLPHVSTVYYLANYLPELPDEHIVYWQSKPIHPTARLFKSPLSRLALAQLAHDGRPISLRYENVLCVSDYVRQRLVSQGLVPDSASVIYNGVDLRQFPPREPGDFPSEVFSCLIAGRVMAEKGIHTAVEAFAVLRSNSNGALPFHLTILGDGPADYVQQLRRIVYEGGIQESVHFMPPIPRADMPEMLRQYQALILPSEYAEPIARSIQEAMAVGLLVIGTNTGGSGELLVHEQTGLVFEAGNAHSLAQQLARAVNEPNLASELAAAGQARVGESFRIDQTISKVETYLQNLVNQRNRSC